MDKIATLNAIIPMILGGLITIKMDPSSPLRATILLLGFTIGGVMAGNNIKKGIYGNSIPAIIVAGFGIIYSISLLL